MGGGSTPSPYRIVITLRRTERCRAAALDAALGTIDLTAAQFHVLEELTATPVLHVGELAWRHGVTRQSMHGIVRNLARAQLVALAPPEHGVRNVWLTRDGRERLVSAREAVSGIERRVADALGSEGGVSLVRHLADISRSVEDRRGWVVGLSS